MTTLIDISMGKSEADLVTGTHKKSSWIVPIVGILLLLLVGVLLS